MLFLLKLLDYNILFVNFIIIAIIASILLVLNFIIRQKNNNWEINIQKYAAYECGFEPFSETQSQVFEIQFFLVSIMFLIFDVELALMFPWAVYFSFLTKASFWIMISFILLLTVGFFYEWEKGALNWNAFFVKNKMLVLFSISFENLEGVFFNVTDFFFILEHLLASIILVLLIIGITLQQNLNQSEALVAFQKIVTSVFAISFLYYAHSLVFYEVGATEFIFNNYFVIDAYTQFSKLFTCFSLLCIVLFWAKNYIYYHKYIIWEMLLLILLASWFMFLLLSSFNLFSLFISLEGLSLCLYILAAYDFDRRTSAEAAIKYFTLGTLSSGFLLMGIVFMYIAVGSLDYFEIFILANEAAPQYLIRISSCLIFFSFIFKLGAWPCHQWVPDVYQGAPTIITAFFATAVKSALFFSVIRLFNYIVIEKPLLAIICVMSLLVGIVGAIKTDKIKRFIAYAAINQIGFILIGIFIYATEATLIYFILYIITTLMIFMIILKTLNLTASSTFEITFLADLKIVSFYNKQISIYLIIILFGMAGLPPFLTSLAKWYILLMLAINNYILLLAITTILTIFSIYYYMKLIKHIFFEPLAISSTTKNTPTFFFVGTSLDYAFLFFSAFLLLFGPIFLNFTTFFIFFSFISDIIDNCLNILILSLDLF